MKIFNSRILSITFFMMQFVFLLQLSTNLIVISQTDIPEPQYGGTMVDSSISDAQLLNPVLSIDSTSKKIENFIFQGLMSYDEHMNVIPGLATSWVLTPSKLNYTFHLRDDVYWHDGEKFTVEDVIFTWDRILDPETDTTCVSMFDLLDKDNVPYEMIDNYTVIFNLKTTFSPMLNNMMFPIIPEHVYENHDGVDGIKHTSDDCRDVNGVYTFNNDPANMEPIGTGSLMFSEWEKEDHISLIQNSIVNEGPGNWRQHNTYLDGYILRIESDINSQLVALQNGDIDIMNIASAPQEDINALEINENINVYYFPSYKTEHIAFQTNPEKGNLYDSTSRNFTTNPNHFAGYKWQTAEDSNIYGHLVRQALNYGLDKDGLLYHSYQKGSRNLGPLPTALYEWYNDQVEPYKYNSTKANQLLEQAGFGATADDPLRHELDFRISYNKDDLIREKICKFARDQWAILGITVEIESLEWESMFLTHYNERNFDAMVSSSTLEGGDPDLTYEWSSRNIAPNGINYVSYLNPAVNILMGEARTEEAFSVRKTFSDQIQEKIVEDSPYVWLFDHVNMIAINSDFYGFTENSVVGLWAEPIGFRNIYYVQSETNSSSSYTNDFFTSGFISIQFVVYLLFIGIVHKIYRKRK